MLEKKFATFLERSVFIFVSFFSSWTVISNLAVFAHRDFYFLLAIAPVSVMLATILFFYLVRQPVFVESAENTAMDNSFYNGFLLKILFTFAIILLLVLYRVSKNYPLFWCASLIFLSFSYLYKKRIYHPSSCLSLDLPKTSYFDLSIFVLTSVFFIILVLLCNAPSLDESLLINLSIGALDHPDWPLIHYDTMHGVEGLGILVPPYKVHSLELLYSVLSYATGSSVIFLRHLVFPSLFAVFAIIAWSLFHRKILPKQWIFGMLLTVILFVSHGDTFRTYGNFSFIHLYNGKSVFVTIMVPLLIWAAMRWSQNSNLANWLLLAATQIISVGMTANALYLAPITAGIILFACWLADGLSIRRFFTGLLASSYPVLLSLLLLSTTVIHPSENAYSGPIEDDMAGTFGWSVARWILLSSFIGSWIFIENKAVQKIFIIIPAISLLTIANPFLSDFWGGFVTGHLNWRLFWAVPAIAMLAIFIITSVNCIAELYLPRLQSTINWLVILFFSVVAGTWQYSTLSDIEWFASSPGYKVPAADYELAKYASSMASPNTTVLAPANIAGWILTLRNHPSVVVSRPVYLIHLKNLMAPKDLAQRAIIYDYIAPESTGTSEGKKMLETMMDLGYISLEDLSHKNAANSLKKAIDDLRISLIVINRENPHLSEIETLLQDKGFKNEVKNAHDFWYRK